MSIDGIVCDPAVCDWVSAIYYGEPGHIDGVGFGVMQAGGLVGGVAFHDWRKDRGTLEVSAAATRKGWVTRDFLRAVGDYAFRQVGCRLVIARTSERNSLVRRVFRKLGAAEHVIPGIRGPNEAEVIITLSARAWGAYEVRL